MNGSRAKQHKDKPAQQTGHMESANASGFMGPQASLLALQRAAGNSAVNELFDHSQELVPKASSSRLPQQLPDQASKSGGQPLESQTRGYMERLFGQDFSTVKVHTDSQAEESASQVNAKAYTLGNSIVFGRGRYAPQTGDGKRLIAHELAHVVQQSRGGEIAGPAETSQLETAADQAAKTATNGSSGKVEVAGAAAPSIMRQTDDPEADDPSKTNFREKYDAYVRRSDKAGRTPEPYDTWQKNRIGMGRYGGGATRRHHLIPQAMPRNHPNIAARLQALKIDVHKWVIDIPNDLHNKIHSGSGGGKWNQELLGWFEKNPQFSEAQLREKVNTMMDTHKIPKRYRTTAPRYGRGQRSPQFYADRRQNKASPTQTQSAAKPIPISQVAKPALTPQATKSAQTPPAAKNQITPAVKPQTPPATTNQTPPAAKPAPAPQAAHPAQTPQAAQPTPTPPAATTQTNTPQASVPVATQANQTPTSSTSTAKGDVRAGTQGGSTPAASANAPKAESSTGMPSTRAQTPLAASTPPAQAKGTAVAAVMGELNSMIFGKVQSIEAAKAAARLEELTPEITRLLEEGNNVTVTIEVEVPTTFQFGVVKDIGQVVYFRSMYISRLNTVKPIKFRPLTPAEEQQGPSMSAAPTIREGFGDPRLDDPDLTFDQRIRAQPLPKLGLRGDPDPAKRHQPKHANHRIMTRDQIFMPSMLTSPPGVQPQVPSGVYLFSADISKQKIANEIQKKLAGDASFPVVMNGVGHTDKTGTVVNYFNDLDRARAEELAKIIRSAGVSAVHTELIRGRRDSLRGQGQSPPGILVVILGKDKPQLDEATKKALAEAPSRLYFLTANIIQYKTAYEIQQKLLGHPSFIPVKDHPDMGWRYQKRTVVRYWNALDKPRAEELAKIIRSMGVSSAYAELSRSSNGDDTPGTMQIEFGEDAEFFEWDPSTGTYKAKP